MRVTPTNTRLKVQEYLILNQKVQDILISYGISMTEFKILAFLVQCDSNDEILNVDDVSKKLVMDRGWVFKLFRNLENKNLVFRSKNGMIFLNNYHLILFKKIEMALSS